MGELLKPDLCVIGAGSGGLSVAAATAAFGVPVVLIERGKMGGDCLNYGCVPSKALIAASRRAHGARESTRFGLRQPRFDVDFAAVHDHIHGVIAAIAPNDSVERFNGLGVRVIAGEARFKDRRTVVVGDSIEIKARRFVIATGSSPALPPIPGLEKTPHLTNETIFDLTECPKHLVVIGGGPIGLELAQAYRRLGAMVTVLEALKPLARDDVECTAVVLDQIERDGINIRTGVNIIHVKGDSKKISAVLKTEAGEETIEGSHLLVAAGRRPNLQELDLEAGGVIQERQGIVVDRRLRTSNKRVFAIGDVAGGLQFTHLANHHAGIVIRNVLFRLPAKADAVAVPRVTFTDPELAHVGLTEDEARAQGHKIRILRWPYHENDRAQAERATNGHIKVVTNHKGQILGVTIVGAEAGELITTWTLAINERLNIRALTGIIVPYPTLAEIGKRAAITYFIPSLTSPWVRRMIAFLRLFG
ncbi:MAG: FAD-dependent oxidoreductase [Rhizobiales bacterium]|nr:FAD-dependent oxidoreductase [Hyphomicrobiales bacterium]